MPGFLPPAPSDDADDLSAVVCIAYAEGEVCSGLSEGFWVSVELCVLDVDADPWVSCAEGGELFERREGLLGEFVDGRDRVDFEGVDEVFWCEEGVGVVDHGFCELIEAGIVAGHSRGHVVSAEGFEVVGAGFESGVDAESFDATT